MLDEMSAFPPLRDLSTLYQMCPELHTIGKVPGPAPGHMRLGMRFDAGVVLARVRRLRLALGYLPSRSEAFSNACCDTEELLEMIGSSDRTWRPWYVALRLARHGLYSHPHVVRIRINGCPITDLLDELLDFEKKRGLSYGLLRSLEHGSNIIDWDENIVCPRRQELRELECDICPMVETLLGEMMEESS